MAITTWPIFYIACESHIVLQCPLLSNEMTLCSREVEDLRRSRNSQQAQSVTTHFNPKLRDHETVTESALCLPKRHIQDISPHLLPPSFDILHWMDMHLMDMDFYEFLWDYTCFTKDCSKSLKLELQASVCKPCKPSLGNGS